MAEKKAQDFEDLLSGKKQDQSEKNLQTIFKEFYTEVRKVDPKTYVSSAKNSAKTSLGSLSSKLEARREKLQKMKEDALNIDKEKQKDEPETKQKVDTSKDKFTTAEKQT